MFQDFQLKIIHFLQQMSNPFLDGLFEFITFFGESILVIALIGYFYWIYDKKMGNKLIVTMLSSMTFNCAVKGMVKANRPFQDDSTVINKRPETATGYSFPSGHSQTAATLYTSIMLFFKKNWLRILMPILIILVMISRLYLGAHYPVDVLVGGLIGVLFALFIPPLVDKIGDLRWFNLTLVIMFLPFCVLFLYRKDATNYDFFKMYGLLIGYYFAYLYETRFVKFDTNISTSKKVIRYIVGIIIVVSLQVGLKALFALIFKEPSFILQSFIYMIRYGLITFIGLGIYPHLFKKLNF